MRTPFVLTAGGLVGLVAVSGGLARRARAGRARRLAVTPGDVGLVAETVTLRSPQDTDLHAWWIERPDADGTPAPTVLVVHGYASHSGDLLPAARLLHDAGLNVLLIDLRGHGRSETPPSFVPPPMLSGDVGVALDWLHDRSDVDGVALLGHSMGGMIAVLAAAERADVAAVVTVSAVADPTLGRIAFWPGFVNRAFLSAVGRRRGVDPDRLFAINRIGDVEAPVLLIHGGSDRVVPVAHSHALKAARPDAELIVVPGAGHTQLDRFAPAFRTAIRFLRRHATTTPVDAAAG